MTSEIDLVAPPVRIELPGEFWDSQVYAGGLLLFTREGSIRTLDWRQLVAELPIAEELRIVADAALLSNHRLYGAGARELISDPEVRSLLMSKFVRLSQAVVLWDAASRARVSEFENPVPHPHNDSEIHYDQLFLGGTSGLYQIATDPARRGKRTRQKRSDVAVLDLAAAHKTLAVAAGADGLFEAVITDTPHRDLAPLTTVLEETCSSCDWSFESLIASGPKNRLTFAEYDRVPASEPRAGRRIPYVRKFEQLLTESDLFGSEAGESAICWGAHERVYRALGSRVETVRYQPGRATENTPAFLSPEAHQIDMADSGLPPLSARTAAFGSVLELDDALHVIPTLGTSFTIPGEPVSWRVFPRSRDYLNHLHIVYEDRLVIYAFTHDYFADQDRKWSGFEVGRSETAVRTRRKE
ncbi:hypothetical protein [Roseisolibacter agri]|uniref:Uncharacterized protein n=1 Tax=Roseisolibacter agri TaxID=2014610 RepID=A0AA37QJQ0_9BACT|nr:hypothetical protein [Roseisolibacter agri]GLC27750.1 hypothetical protein rosag_42630 [Roseisolibacter agri]